MKIDAKVTLKKNITGILATGQTIKVPVDMDYTEDYDDVVQAVESELYERYGVSLFNEVDFTIANASDICEDLAAEAEEPDKVMGNLENIAM